MVKAATTTAWRAAGFLSVSSRRPSTAGSGQSLRDPRVLPVHQRPAGPRADPNFRPDRHYRCSARPARRSSRWRPGRCFHQPLPPRSYRPSHRSPRRALPSPGQPSHGRYSSRKCPEPSPRPIMVMLRDNRPRLDVPVGHRCPEVQCGREMAPPRPQDFPGERSAYPLRGHRLFPFDTVL